MNKRFISVIIIFLTIVVSLLALSSCNKKDDNAVIQLWYYDFKDDLTYLDYMKDIREIVRSAKKFCENNDIPLDIVKYDSEIMTHDDYTLKRNIAAASGNMIIIEDIKFLQAIANLHADYSKLDSYKDLTGAYKDRFCIPLGLVPMGFAVENKALEYYGIDTYQKSILTYTEYLKIKQNIKQSGAKFELYYDEFKELVWYYLSENGLFPLNSENEIIKNNDKFKEMLKKIIFDICEDIVLYYDGTLYEYIKYENIDSEDYLYDENSQLPFRTKIRVLHSFADPQMYRNVEDIDTKTFVAYPRSSIFDYSPSFYMYKKITNKKIYDLANYIISDSNYANILSSYSTRYSNYRYPHYIPIYNTEKIRKELMVDENWVYKGYENLGKHPERVKKIVKEAYEALAVDENKSKEIADYYFSDSDYRLIIEHFIDSTIVSIARELSGEHSAENSSLEKFDRDDEKINKFIDEKIDEFINNFNVHYK